MEVPCLSVTFLARSDFQFKRKEIPKKAKRVSIIKNFENAFHFRCLGWVQK